MGPALDVLPSSPDEEDLMLKTRLNRGRHVMAYAPSCHSIAADTSTTDQRDGPTSDHVGSYEDRDSPRSYGMRQMEIMLAL